MQTFKAELKYFEPIVGMESCVGVSDGPYPMDYGNYCSLVDGPYLCNMWSENLREWSKRYLAEEHAHPMLQVLVFESLLVEMPKQDGLPVALSKTIGFVADDRCVEWTNPHLCVTGHGWPNEEIKVMACQLHDVWKEEAKLRRNLKSMQTTRKELLAEVCKQGTL